MMTVINEDDNETPQSAKSVTRSGFAFDTYPNKILRA
jgi:hypothetical protein